jgi:hypothetical protein
MSLELFRGTALPPAAEGVSSPIWELLYFLHGSGSVSVQLPDQQPWCKDVRAGDSVFAPLHTITVHGGAMHNADDQLACLRVYLPIKYVLESAQDPNLVLECQRAATEVRIPHTSHLVSS